MESSNISKFESKKNKRGPKRERDFEINKQILFNATLNTTCTTPTRFFFTSIHTEAISDALKDGK